MQLLCSSYNVLFSNKLKALYIIIPCKPVHTNISASQQSIQPRYMLQGATDDQRTIASWLGELRAHFRYESYSGALKVWKIVTL